MVAPRRYLSGCCSAAVAAFAALPWPPAKSACCHQPSWPSGPLTNRPPSITDINIDIDISWYRRYCDDDVCPAGRGECRAARGGSGDDYVTVSKCYCFYGYGGEACAQRVVSYVSMLWQVRGGWPMKNECLG